MFNFSAISLALQHNRLQVSKKKICTKNVDLFGEFFKCADLPTPNGHPEYIHGSKYREKHEWDSHLIRFVLMHFKAANKPLFLVLQPLIEETISLPYYYHYTMGTLRVCELVLAYFPDLFYLFAREFRPKWNYIRYVELLLIRMRVMAVFQFSSPFFSLYWLHSTFENYSNYLFCIEAITLSHTTYQYITHAPNTFLVSPFQFIFSAQRRVQCGYKKANYKSFILGEFEKHKYCAKSFHLDFIDQNINVEFHESFLSRIHLLFSFQLRHRKSLCRDEKLFTFKFCLLLENLTISHLTNCQIKFGTLRKPQSIFSRKQKNSFLQSKTLT